MLNHLTIMQRSVIPEKVKRNSLTQEVIRRLRNTSRKIDWGTKAEILSKFSHSMMILGYNQEFRTDIIMAGMKGFEKQCNKSNNRDSPLH